MDVRCTRCGTEYEFDDALISERGTSVRCTQCGFQFRVFPPQAKIVGPDEWVVLTSLGRRVVYRSLRELQNGISRGDVAREDLLARGSAPPRPLGSIAELDPLFSVKAAPERKSSTLTGVAPPPKMVTPRSTEASTVEGDVANPLREHQDTWSGVAPPAQVKALVELPSKPTHPMRVGSSTVLGLGNPEAKVARQPAEKTHAPEVSVVSPHADNGSLPPETRSYEAAPTAASEAKAVTPEAPVAATGFEVVGAKVVAKTTVPAEVSDSEPPTLPPPASTPLPPEPEAAKPESTGESASVVEVAHPESVSDVAPLTEPPTVRWTEGPTGDASAEPSVKTPKPTPKPRTALSEKEAADASRQTRPPSRPKHGKPQPQKAKPTPWGFVLLGVVLLGGGLYAGMQLVGMKLRKAVPTSAHPEVLKAPVGSVVAHGAEVPVSAPWSSVEEALEVGDSETATRLLDTVNEGLKDSPEYRRLRILTDAMAIDMLWWQRRILPKTETSQISSLTTTLTARLTALSGLLERCSADEDCSTKTISAKWALGRMQGQVALVQRPKHGTVDATGLYQLAMLDWVAADKPDSKTLDRLTKARLAGVEQGPRVTALIVALIDSKRFDDARAELAKLSTATKAHPHLEALNRYLRLADTVPTEDAGVPDVESDEGDANDPDLREPDFRIRLQRAAGCLSRSEVTKAQKLFRSVLAQRPNDIEALTGIADILRRRGNLAQARTQYDRVLALNGNYLPAMVGSAETRWKSGDRPGAVTTYRRIVELVGEGPGYGQQAAARIKEFEGVKSEPSPASDGNSTKGVTAPAADAPRKTP